MGHTLTHDFGFLYSKSIQYHTISCLWQVSWSSGMYNPIYPCSRRCTCIKCGHSLIINLSQGMYNCKTLMLLVSKRQHCIIEDVLMSKLFSRMIAHRWFSQLLHIFIHWHRRLKIGKPDTYVDNIGLPRAKWCHGWPCYW